MPETSNAAKTEFEHDQAEEERRQGAKDRRIAGKDRRNPERVAEEIAPRRHPEIRGRRSSDG